MWREAFRESDCFKIISSSNTPTSRSILIVKQFLKLS